MGIRVSSGNYEIIASGTVAAFSEDSDVTFQHDADEKFGFGFALRLVFKKDDSGNQVINSKINGNVIEYECCNFSDSGTGTGVPIKLASSKGKNMYFRFWSYLDGDIAGQRKTRKVEYTFFVGE